MTLGEQIRQARENKNLSQEELASQLGVSRQAVSKWENDSSVPQGINREMLSQLLELEISLTEGALPGKRSIGMWLGWVLAAILFLMLCICVGIGLHLLSFQDGLDGSSENSEHWSEQWEEQRWTEASLTPAVKNVWFYDSDQNIVGDVALWYNAAEIDSILIQWEGGTPSNIKVFYTPSGTEMMEQTELLMTKSILDGDTVALLSADVLKEIVQGDVYFELDFGTMIVSSNIYNIFYDPSLSTEM
ncbi:MAG: helix-turn-helix transcriptional regulator [Acetatifactor sp.]|nr:helix-turn-helix transcriptional regulator [Acetatifactor sp.]